MERVRPTPYPDVNAILERLLSEAQAILGPNFLGMYLTGSLASGDFDPENSDIDFVVVTASELSEEAFAALAAMHERIAAGPSKWATEIEGSYIPQHALRRYDPAQARHPHIFRGRGEGESELFMMVHASDWVVQYLILREQGVVLAGPEPRTFIELIHPDELRHAVRAFAHEQYTPFLEDPELLSLHDEVYHAYTVVTMCRILYTLERGSIASKPVAARWAQEQQGRRWAGLIEQALALDLNGDTVDEMLDFMRYVLAQ